MGVYVNCYLAAAISFLQKSLVVWKERDVFLGPLHALLQALNSFFPVVLSDVEFGHHSEKTCLWAMVDYESFSQCEKLFHWVSFFQVQPSQCVEKGDRFP